jgi:hypothetical protein
MSSHLCAVCQSGSFLLPQVRRISWFPHLGSLSQAYRYQSFSSLSRAVSLLYVLVSTKLVANFHSLMCGPTSTTTRKQTEASLSRSNDDNDNNEAQPKAEESKYKYWPLHPLAVLALFPLLPTEFYLNRGYTQWFHWTAVVYLLTGSAFLRRFLVVQGTGVTLGWYSALANDLYWNGKFCHVLYKNMPIVMTNVMLDSQTKVLLQSWEALSVMGVSHLLDTLAHPLLTLYMWRLHCRSGGSLRDLFSWNVVVSTFALSRLWSLTHTMYNFGTSGWGLYYFGSDVYILDDLESWISAYVAEGLFYVAIVLYKIFWEQSTTVMSTTTATVSEAKGLVDVVNDTKPSLMSSESGVSIQSM